MLEQGFKDYIRVIQLAIQLEVTSLGKCTVIKKNAWNKVNDPVVYRVLVSYKTR